VSGDIFSRAWVNFREQYRNTIGDLVENMDWCQRHDAGGPSLRAALVERLEDLLRGFNTGARARRPLTAINAGDFDTTRVALL
jgi:hypothetical protein